jgi:hypothetical protein
MGHNAYGSAIVTANAGIVGVGALRSFAGLVYCHAGLFAGARRPSGFRTRGGTIMSRCIDLFIDAPMALEQFATELGQLAGVEFIAEVDGSSWLLRQDEIVARLAEHGFDDDRHLPLSKYRFDLSCRLDSRNALDTQEAALLRRVLAAVKADGRYSAVLVFDLQHVVDKAEGRAVRAPVQ